MNLEIDCFSRRNRLSQGGPWEKSLALAACPTARSAWRAQEGRPRGGQGQRGTHRLRLRLAVCGTPRRHPSSPSIARKVGRYFSQHISAEGLLLGASDRVQENIRTKRKAWLKHAPGAIKRNQPLRFAKGSRSFWLFIHQSLTTKKQKSEQYTDKKYLQF